MVARSADRGGLQMCGDVLLAPGFPAQDALGGLLELVTAEDIAVPEAGHGSQAVDGLLEVVVPVGHRERLFGRSGEAHARPAVDLDEGVPVAIFRPVEPGDCATGLLVHELQDLAGEFAVGLAEGAAVTR